MSNTERSQRKGSLGGEPRHQGWKPREDIFKEGAGKCQMVQESAERPEECSLALVT